MVVPVTIEERDGRFVLRRGGHPFALRGAGGRSQLALLAQAGGTTIRTWDADDAERLLDEAHAHGLTVTLGLRLGAPRHGFDYADPQQVQAQRDHVDAVVRRYKDHPALLMWGLGNELAIVGDPRAPFDEIEHLAQRVRAADPHHPTMAVVAGAAPDKIRLYVERCPSVHVLGVNAYGQAAQVPGDLLAAGYSGPFALTEFGPRGWWESPTTQWGAQVEPTSAEKVEHYRSTYDAVVRAHADRCLGAYVFLWGQKQEATSTWFGLFLDDGSKTPVVDLMHRLWTGRESADRAPIVSAIALQNPDATFGPGQPFRGTCAAEDPDGDDVSLHWEVVAEASDRGFGGDPEAPPPRLPGQVMAQWGAEVEVRAPEHPGHYRLFVIARDPAGNAGTANVPFRVVR